MPSCLTIETVQLPGQGDTIPSIAMQQLPVANTVITPAAASAQTTPAAILYGKPFVKPPRSYRPIGQYVPHNNFSVGRTVQGGGIADLGYTFFCSDFNAVKSNLQAAVDSAIAQGLPPQTSELVSAQAFLKQYGDPIDIVIPFIGSDCQKMIDEGNKNLAALTQVLVAAGGQSPTLPRPFLDPTQSTFGLSTLFSAKVLIPAAIIVGGIAFGPSIYALIKARRAAKRAASGVSGIGRKRRRRR